MRILSVVGKNYAGCPGAIEPMFLEFTVPLREMGHDVEHFDHQELVRRVGLEACGESFLNRLRSSKCDLVFYQTAGRNHMPPEAIRDAGRFAPIIAWNSDDDWQWEHYTSRLAPYFTFMITTYPAIYEANHHRVPNLLLSQWGCYEPLARFDQPKDLSFTFLGRIYGRRYHDCRFLRKEAGLQVLGSGSRLIALGIPPFRGCGRIPGLMGPPVADYADANALWNRSRVSFTPLGSSLDPNILQLKGRVFQMGLSGTLMLCDRHPELSRYYEPDKEFISFDGLQDCAEKVRYFLAHEDARARIARAYHDRTRAEHLWQHRFLQIFRDVGVN